MLLLLILYRPRVTNIQIILDFDGNCIFIHELLLMIMFPPIILELEDCLLTLYYELSFVTRIFFNRDEEIIKIT